MLPCIAVWLPCVYRASAYQAHYLFAWFPIVGVNSLLYSCVYELMTHTVSRSCTEISFSFCTRTLISCLNSLSLCECLSSLTRHVSQSGNSLFKKKKPLLVCVCRGTLIMEAGWIPLVCLRVVTTRFWFGSDGASSWQHLCAKPHHQTDTKLP